MSIFVRSIYTAGLLSALYVGILYISDKFRRESFINVTIAFFCGVFSALLVSLIHEIFPWIFNFDVNNKLFDLLFLSQNN